MPIRHEAVDLAVDFMYWIVKAPHMRTHNLQRDLP
jgi:hypothetical protein